MMKFTYRKNTVIEGILVEETETHYVIEIDLEGDKDLVSIEKELTVITETFDLEAN